MSRQDDIWNGLTLKKSSRKQADFIFVVCEMVIMNLVFLKDFSEQLHFTNMVITVDFIVGAMILLMMYCYGYRYHNYQKPKFYVEHSEDKMGLYCSSPKCRNECNKKYDSLAAWEDPESVKGILMVYHPFCDAEGNKLKITTTNLAEISS
jgi:hypothetical protein